MSDGHRRHGHQSIDAVHVMTIIYILCKIIDQNQMTCQEPYRSLIYKCICTHVCSSERLTVRAVFGCYAIPPIPEVHAMACACIGIIMVAWHCHELNVVLLEFLPENFFRAALKESERY